MAASIRSTPNYSVPPTQNTAPVLEFRCLYTHDLLKKQKKWHDGSLKFHTFNRRVMVYDDVKNYVGDLHYREQEEFGEGIELQLDRPVKVEVGEPIGRTETDLAPILDRGRGEREVRSIADAPASYRPVQRVHAPNHNGKPKSLMDVLGMSQGRAGRARIPPQSPYEQRQQLAEATAAPPSAKRQRIMYGTENDQLRIPQPATQRIDTALFTKRRNSGASRQQQSDAVLTATKSIQSSTIFPNVEQIQHKRHPSKLQSKTKARLAKATSATKENQKPLTVSKSNEVIELIDSTHTPSEVRQEKAAAKSLSTLSTPTVKVDPPVAPNRTATKQNVPTRVAMALLRFQNKAPRKKLLYKALLPDSNCCMLTSPKLKRNNLTSPDKSQHSVEVSNSSVAAERSVAITSDQDPVRDSVEANNDRLTSPPLLESATTRNEQPDTVLISSSPMFFSQDMSQISQPSSPPAMVDDGIDYASMQGGEECEYIDEETGPAVDVNTMVDRSPSPCIQSELNVQINTNDGELNSSNPSISPAISQEVRQMSLSASLCDKPDSIRYSALPEELLQQDSENNFPNPIPDHMNASHGQNTEPAISTSHGRDMASSPVPIADSPLKQSLQRGQSDSAALARMTMAPPITVRPSQWTQAKKDDQGPWTKLEAFLLFDKWPAAKAKEKSDFLNSRLPQNTNDNDFDDYDGLQEHIELSMDTHVRTNVRSCRIGADIALPGIRSARAVLRDEF